MTDQFEEKLVSAVWNEDKKKFYDLVKEADLKKYGYKILSLSLAKGLMDLVEDLMKKGFDIKDKRLKECMASAALGGHINVIKFFLENGYGIDTTTKDNLWRTPLMYACEGGHVELVKFLIEKGADVNAKDDDYAFPLFYVFAKEKQELDEKIRLEIIKILLDNGAEIEEYIDKFFMLAINREYLEILKFFIKQGFDINCCTNSYEGTPLHYAKKEGKLRAAKVLEDAGAIDATEKIRTRRNAKK